MELCVDIQIVQSREKRISKAPVPFPRTLSLPNAKQEGCIYDVCHFTTEEGINVSWKYGSIENEMADVLVNSAHSNLNHPTACGRALTARGRSCYTEACKPYTDVPPGDIVATESGNLLSKYVIHAVCCNLDQFEHWSLAYEFLRELVAKILEKSQELSASSLAIPLLGTGQHGFPEEAVLKIVKNEITQFSSNKGFRLTLKDVRIIVFKAKAKRRQTMPSPKGPRNPPFPSPETNHSTFTFGHVRIVLCGGNVMQYDADAFMNLTSEYIRVSKRTNVGTIAEIELTDHLMKPNIKPPPGTVLVTDAARCETMKYCLYCVPVSSDISGLESATKACLDAAKFLTLNSIKLSASWMLAFGVTKNECADIILKACETFSKSKYTIVVTVVMFGAEMMTIFKKAFEEKVKERDGEVLQGDESVSPGATSLVDKTLSIGEKKEDVILRVVGLKDNVNKAIAKTEAYFNRSKEQKSIKGEKMASQFRAHKSRIKELLKEYEVLITASAEEVLIEGMEKQVFECKDMLTDYLMKCDEKEREVQRLHELSEPVQWSYSDENGLVLFDEILNGIVESESRASNKKFTIHRMDNAYEFDLDLKTIKENCSGRTAELTRKHAERALDLPAFWEPQPEGKEVHLVTLSSSSSEYRKIEDLVDPVKDLIRIQKIERVQNPRLYKAYLGKKESMGKECNERQLFHGTKTENVSSINTNNFSKRFSGVNGTRFGHGVYFARDFAYSAKFSLKGSTERTTSFHIYVVKVLVGKSVKGSKDMRVLPKRNDPSNPELLYDSAVDSIKHPSTYVTFDDHQCYPEYLVTFTAAASVTCTLYSQKTG